VSSVDVTIREVLKTHARLVVPIDTLTDTNDLYENGMTSHASVNVMLALEDEFDVEFSESLLRKGTFQSVAAIRTALGSMGVDIS
jgi:acyl carrier protein